MFGSKDGFGKKFHHVSSEPGTYLFYEDSDSSPSRRAKTQRLESKSLKFQRLGLKSESKTQVRLESFIWE